MTITQEELKECVHYDPETGIFTRLKSFTNSVKVGDVITNKSHGYIDVTIKNKKYKSHRLVWLYMYGKFPKHEIDHINNVRDDNRLSNLREATRRDNMRNVGVMKTNKSGYKGVSWHTQNKTWRARIKLGGKMIYLGCFDSVIQASNAYKFFASYVHGQYFNNRRT